MRQTEPPRTWLFVVHVLLHLSSLKAGEKSWWCVDRRSKPGEKAFIYQPLRGVRLLVEILDFSARPEGFCNGFAMATANIKVLKIFDPPVKAKQLKSSKIIGSEGFIGKNFQGKAFLVRSEQAVKAIISMGTSKRRKE